MLLSTKDGVESNRDAVIGVVDVAAAGLPNLPYFLVRQKKSWVDSGSGSLPSEW
jgi:hypothetical protein